MKKQPKIIETGRRNPLLVVPRDHGWSLQSGAAFFILSDDEMAALLDHVTQHSEGTNNER